MIAAGIDVISDDLARGVDAARNGAAGGRGIVDRGEGAAAQEKAMVAGAVGEIADDLWFVALMPNARVVANGSSTTVNMPPL